MKIKTKYIVMTLEKTHKVDVYGHEFDLPLIWADRMCGAMPVFDTKKAAQKYAGKKFQISKAIIEDEEGREMP